MKPLRCDSLSSFKTAMDEDMHRKKAENEMKSCIAAIFMIGFVFCAFLFIMLSADDKINIQIPSCVKMERTDMDDLAQAAASQAVALAFKADSWFGPNCSDKEGIAGEIVRNFVAAIRHHKNSNSGREDSEWNCIIFEKGYGLAKPLHNFVSLTYRSKRAILFKTGVEKKTLIE